VSNSTFSGNVGIDGGAIENQSGSLSVSGSALSSNSANYEGAGMFISGGTVALASDTIGSNTATSDGGGIYIAAGAAVSIDAFTVADTINNTDGSGLNRPTANIDVSYKQR
jgi:hypothetical protein